MGPLRPAVGNKSDAVKKTDSLKPSRNWSKR